MKILGKIQSKNLLNIWIEFITTIYIDRIEPRSTIKTSQDEDNDNNKCENDHLIA